MPSIFSDSYRFARGRIDLEPTDGLNAVYGDILIWDDNVIALHDCRCDACSGFG